MSEITIYYHDPVEVNPKTSWTGLSNVLKNARLEDITKTDNSNVKSLFAYARPDAVVTVDDMPAVSIEQTQMNPSGHNIPQRFSSQVRAAELGVPSILYYPEYARRTFSDPNVRYLQVRVPMAQLRLSAIYKIPALSVFWPTNNTTKLPETKQSAHQDMANVVTTLIQNIGKGEELFRLPYIKSVLERMSQVITKYSNPSRYRKNKTVRVHLPNGFSTSKISKDFSIDPPTKSELVKTDELLNSLNLSNMSKKDMLSKLKSRELSLIFRGTTNKNNNDSEHPWPGYLTLLDILYARSNLSKEKTKREVNLVYELPVAVNMFLARLNRHPPPTATFIVDSFADLLILKDGVVPGIPIRGNIKAVPLN